MRTPVGIECKYFYGDYFRGRTVEECRLLRATGFVWNKDLCKTCPVPSILRANACEFIQLRARVERPISAAFMKRVKITAYCEKVNKDVSEPQIGCGSCHEVPEIFEKKS